MRKTLPIHIHVHKHAHLEKVQSVPSMILHRTVYLNPSQEPPWSSERRSGHQDKQWPGARETARYLINHYLSLSDSLE